MDQYYREGFEVTAKKLKTEFRKISSSLVEVYATLQKSRMGNANKNDDCDHNDDDDDKVVK